MSNTPQKKMTLNAAIWKLQAAAPLSATKERKIRENAFAFGLPPAAANTHELQKWKNDVLEYAMFR